MTLININSFYNGDSLDVLKTFDSESIDCVVTSPPYYGLRNYGHEEQIGLEETPERYIDNLVNVFREVKRVLKNEGTVWVNLGDSYFHKRSKNGLDYNCDNGKNGYKSLRSGSSGHNFYKSKDLMLLPHRFALAMIQDGWYLRQDIVWNKPNPMPESVKDRCTKSHEYIFLFAKSPKYFFDSEAIAEPVADSTIPRIRQDIGNQAGSVRAHGAINMKAKKPRYMGDKYTSNPDSFFRTKSPTAYDYRPFRNKRSVWTVTTKPYKEAHFAVYPTDLIEPCILAGCPEDGIVLDPFSGSGTTAYVAVTNRRNFIGIELNKDYIKISEKRLSSVQVKLL